MGIIIGRRTASDYYKRFLGLPVDKKIHELTSKPPEFWEDMSKKRALEVFVESATKVSAYSEFLKKNSFQVEKIHEIRDLSDVPAVSKKNYLNLHPLKSLCINDTLDNQGVISVSSGSTGEPFFWPRDEHQELEVDSYYEQLLKQSFEVDKYKTLLIVGYSMGMYVAGPFTFASCLRISQKGYPLTIVTPGIELTNIVRVISHLAPQFEQIIIAGYPPFIKDILDAGDKMSVPWKQIRMRFIFGAESFSEGWRQHVLSRVRADEESQNSANTYGSADSAILGMETNLSIHIRKILEDNIDLRKKLFGSERVPALFQYNPIFKYFEVLDDNTLIFTAGAGLPLVRYKIGDNGGVIKYKDMIDTLKSVGVELPDVMIRTSYKIPFVYLYDRADFTVHLYGVNIYIENIKSAFETAVMANNFTGKFNMTVTTKRNYNQQLTINLELAKGADSTRLLKRLAEKQICETLKSKNSEYNRLFQSVGKKAVPKVKLIEHGNKKFFSVGVKQKWKS